MKIPLAKEKKLPFGGVSWTSATPFVENSRAVLIHRPRHVTIHKIGDRWKAHLAVHMWCGSSMTGTKKFTFLDTPPQGRIVCARCEEMAVKHGLQTSDQLSGGHVHIGGVIAVAHCCDSKESAQ